jgi:hypothetical protein
MLGLFCVGMACYCRVLNTEWWVTFNAYSNNMDKKKEMEIPGSYI